MRKIFYKLVLNKDFDGMDISYSLSKDLVFDSLDEALKIGRMYQDKLKCSVRIFEVHSELVSVL